MGAAVLLLSGSRKLEAFASVSVQVTSLKEKICWNGVLVSVLTSNSMLEDF